MAEFVAGTPYAVYSDHLNTPRLIQNASNQAAWQWDNLEPFGTNADNENPSGLGTFVFNLRYPGQYFDIESAAHYNYYRDYNPSVGRYLESDPIGLGSGLNTYSYVHGNPVLFSDPDGLFDPTGWAGTIVRGGLTFTVSTIVAVTAGVVALGTPSELGNESIPSDREWRKRKRWLVYVKCNVNKQVNCENCPDTIGGKAFGDTFPEANAYAQSDANANLSWVGAKGCQARHCHAVKCFENGREVRCPTWN